MKYVIIFVVVVFVLVVISRLITRRPDAGAHAAPKTPYAGPKPLLRQFGDLTPKDFETHPVWVNCHVIDYNQPWYDETDEETFRPWLEDIPVDPAETMFLVRASLRLADGTTIPGFITPQSPQDNPGNPDLGLIQPQLFLPSGKRVSFWFGIMSPPKNAISELYAALGKTGEEVFPLTFNAETGLATGIVSGSVLGFCSKGRGDEVKVEK
jgi:hypothetical protein